MIDEKLKLHRESIISSFKNIMEFKAFTQLAYSLASQFATLEGISDRPLILGHSSYASEVGMTDESLIMSQLPNKFKTSQETHFMSLVHQQQVALFEHLFFDLIKIILIDRPERISKKKQIDYATIFDAESKDQLVEKLVDREINEIKYKSVNEWFIYLGKLVNLNSLPEDTILSISEAKASRDILVHNAGIANSIYVNKSGSAARHSDGELIGVSGDYTKDTWSLFVTTIVGITDELIEKLA